MKCRHCGAEIIWVNVASHRIPLNHPPEQRYMLTAKPPADYAAIRIEAYVPHFPICPRLRHRKEGKDW